MKMEICETKVCSKCHEIKDLSEYYHSRSECKTCSKQYKITNKEKIKLQKQQYYIENKEHIINKQKTYVEKNEDKVKITKCKYREKHKVESREYHQKYHIENKERIQNNSKLHYQRNKIRLQVKHKKWIENNKDRSRFLSTRWAEQNKDRLRIRRREWEKNNKESRLIQRRAQRKQRKSTDTCYKLTCNLRNSLYQSIIKESKKSSALTLLGCSISEFKQYITSKFEPSMDWNNWGKGIECWNIDHVRPISSFDLTDIEQQKLCFHYSNMQPLWEKDNQDKSDRLNWSKGVL